MSASDYLARAGRRLEALASLLEQAAAQGRAVEDILEPALAHLREARQIIQSTYDDEATE